MLSAVLPAHAQQNPVASPGFGTGDFISVSTAPRFVHSGSYGAKLGSVGSDCFLTQNLATQAGQTYNISFFLSSAGNMPNDFSVSFSGNTLLSQTNTLPPLAPGCS